MEIVRPVASIVIVFLLMGATLWLLKRSRRLSFRTVLTGAGRPSMERVGRLQLTPQHALHLVRLDGRVLLVGTHAAGLTVVEARTEAASAAGSNR